MTEGSIEFACPYCDRITRVPAAYGGKQGKCPGCQKVIEVPNPADTPAGAAPTAAVDTSALEATVLEPPPSGHVSPAPPTEPEAIGSPVTEAGPQPTHTPMGVISPKSDRLPPADSGGVEGDQRPCPSCGEQIKSAAKKCKFCGEFLDERLRAERRGTIPLASVGKLASRGTRFASAFVDMLLCYVPSSMIAGVGIFAAEATRTDALAIVGGIAAFLVMLLYNIYSWYLISTTGQNIPKRWFGLKIVKIDGAPVDFVHGVLLRNWVMWAVAVFVPCYLGHLVNLVGYLIIFADDHRCLHDHVASTVVVEA